MRNIILLIILFCFSFLHMKAQESIYRHSNTNVIKFLRAARFNGINVKINTGHQFHLLPLSGTKFEKYTQHYFLSHGEIIVYVGATGLVYRSEGPNEGDSIVFKRLDATQHHGYNINAYPFLYADKIYNIGGYGFWHWNGQLRVFSERSQEWNIIPVNREYALAIDQPGSHLWLNKEEGNLYTFSYIEGNEAIKQQDRNSILKIDSVLELNIKTTNWTSLGKLNHSLTNMINIKSVFANIDSGVLITKDANRLLILNLIANRVDTLVNFNVYQFFATSSDIEIYFYSNNYFYKAIPSKNIIDSIEFNKNDIVIGNQPVYDTSSFKESTNIYVFFLFALVVGSLLLYLSKFQSSILQIFKKNKIDLKSPYKQNQIFDEIEKGLILYIYKKAKDLGTRTTTEELNRIIGVANKSIDMQKRKRSDIIKSINLKYQSSNNKNQLLIDRVKSEFDARLQEYYLTVDTIDFLNDVNNQNQE